MTQTRTRLERGRGALGPALALVHTGRAPTRAVLTAELGVTRATAGAVAAELEALRLIRVDTRPGGPAGAQGRPSHRLAVNPEGPVVLAAQIHADGFRAALVGLGGHILASKPVAMTVPADPARVLGAVVEAGAELLSAAGRACAGAGLAVPSAVAEPEGAALNPCTSRGPRAHRCWTSSASRSGGPASSPPTGRRRRASSATTSTSPRSPSTGTAPDREPNTCWSSPPATAAWAVPSS